MQRVILVTFWDEERQYLTTQAGAWKRDRLYMRVNYIDNDHKFHQSIYI